MKDEEREGGGETGLGARLARRAGAGRGGAGAGVGCPNGFGGEVQSVEELGRVGSWWDWFGGWRSAGRGWQTRRK